MKKNSTPKTIRGPAIKWFPIQDWPATIAGAAICVCFFFCVGIARNALMEKPLPFIAKPPALIPYNPTTAPGQASPPNQSPSEAMRTMTLEQAAALSFDAAARFVDARTQEEFAAGHIEGAINISAYSYDLDLAREKQKLQGVSTIIAYCDGDTCEASLMVARRLNASGYKNVLVFSGGYPAWVAAGYPLAK